MATMFIASMVVLGIASYPLIGVDLFPRVDFPIVSITTTLDGASPEVVDIDVTDKIEEAVNTVNGVKSITSTSSEGRSQVVVEFHLERDIDLALQDVREKVAMRRSSLPTDVREPVIAKVDPDASPILWINVAGEKSIGELSLYADEILKEQLQRVEGVGAVMTSGGRLRQARIWLDPAKMRAHMVTYQDVSSVLARENVELPAGRIEAPTKEYTIKVKGELPRIADFENLVVAYNKGARVRLADIGTVEDGLEEKRSLARFNGQPAVGLGIQKQSGANTVEVANRVKKEIEKIKKNAPLGTSINIVFDQSIYIVRSISEVQWHLVLGGIFAVLTVLLFLKSVRITFISALALPISVIATFTIIHFFNFTFNNLTMLALTLSVGILIDDAIIVVENIHRHIEEGMEPREAASFGTTEIGTAVMATTLAIAVIFLPVAFMKGIIGRFFLQFALTVVFAVFVSMIVSFTLTPMLASIILKKHQKKSRWKFFDVAGEAIEKNYSRIENFYKRLLALSLDNRKTVLLIAAGLFIMSLYITKFMGKEFSPAEDWGQFVVRMEVSRDNSFGRAQELLAQGEERVTNIPEVVSVFYTQGGSEGRVTNARMFVRLKPKKERKKSQEEIKAQIRKELNSIPGIKGSAEDISLIGGALGRNVPIQVAISGGDLNSLYGYTKVITEQFSKIPGVVDVNTNIDLGNPELRVHIDRERATDMGISVLNIAQVINFLIGGETTVTRFKDEERGRRYDVRARLIPSARETPQAIGALQVRTSDGKIVDLANVVSIQEGGAPSTITRVDRQRAIMLFSSLENKPVGEAVNDLNSIAANTLPDNYQMQFKGQASTMAESFQYLLLALLLGIILAYMVLAAQFESFLHPFTVLLAMPLSFIGAFGALILFGKTLSIFSFIGLILLMGLVKKNSILLVDFTNTLRARGADCRTALLNACPVRLRPILMTTFAMIFGMIPVAFGVGEGAETRSPMGIAIIGGLISSLFLTLLVVPVAYDLFDEWKEKLVGKRKNIAERD
ncbi:MAG: efflux RND transporter permease subunit [Deltaproteobacteria bacterium]|nr:efflux RND transporter permease subunit [Deltaproteobacteria bacterium]